MIHDSPMSGANVQRDFIHDRYKTPPSCIIIRSIFQYSRSVSGDAL